MKRKFLLISLLLLSVTTFAAPKGEQCKSICNGHKSKASCTKGSYHHYFCTWTSSHGCIPAKACGDCVHDGDCSVG